MNQPFQRPSIALPARSGCGVPKIGHPSYPRPVKQRYPWGNPRKQRMTIAVGFKVMDGVLICADTQYTLGGILTHDSKLDMVGELPHLRAVFAMAGDNMDLALAAIQNSIRRLRQVKPASITCHWDVAKIVQSVVAEEYRRHVSPHPDPNTASLYQILLAAWTPHDRLDGPGLYVTWKGSIRQCDSYECVGSGFYLGRYLIEAMFTRAMEIKDARIVGTYAIAQAKANVEGCGGRTNIIGLATDGTLLAFDPDETNDFESTFQTFHAKSRQLLYCLLTQDGSRFSASMDGFASVTSDLRVRLGLDAKSKEQKRESMILNFLPVFLPTLEQQVPELTRRDPSLPPTSQE